jgi:hypothetical protein
MRKFFFLMIAALIYSCSSRAQVSAYSFAQSSGTYTVITGTSSTATGDDGTQSSIPIGFNFTYNGIVHTTFSLTTNGCITLTNGAPGSWWTNTLAAAPATNCIAPLWDDNNLTGGTIIYSTTGSVGSQVCTIQWTNCHIGGSGSSTNPTASFQIKLYETSNKIEIIYGGTSGALLSTTASIGITGAIGNYLSVTPGSPATVSSSTANNSISSATLFPNGTIYTFTPPSCLAPSAITSSAVTTTTATISWTAPSPVPSNGYEYEVRTSGAAGSGLTGLTTSGSTGAGIVTANISGLTASTTYSVYVRSNCGGSYSSWTTAYNFTTACGAISSFPWTENFDGVTIPAFPPCWYKENGDWVTTNNAASSFDADAHSGTQFLRETYSATNEYIWTPGFALTSGTSYDFSFWWAGDTYADWTGDIFYNTSQISTGATQLGSSFVVNTTTTTKTYAKVLNTFVAPTTGTYYFAIRVNEATGNPWYLSFDDFTMALTPSCFTPTAVNSSAVTTTTATISWIAASPAPGNGYQYEIRTSGAAGSGATGLTTSGSTGAGIVTANISGLSASTTYNVYVRSDCGAGDYSAWTTVYSFTTACANSTLPLTQGFNVVTIPTCWSQQYVSGTSNIQYLASSSHPTSIPQEGADYVYWNSYSYSAGTESRLVSTPITTTGINSVDVNFYWMNENSTSYNAGAYLNEGVTVQYSTDGSTWNDVQFVARYDASLTSGTNLWKLKSITLPVGAANQPVLYVGFKFHSEFGDNCSMDNLTINATPAGMWSGLVSSDWGTTGNWTSLSLPTSGDNVIINSGAPNMPVVNAAPATPAVCNALTINSGATLTIAAASALTASGVTTNNGTFTLASDATGTGSFIDNGTITGTGTFHVDKYLTGSGGSTPNGAYWYIGSPVPSATSLVFAASGDNRLWSYSEAPTQGYTEITTDGVSLNPLQGYVARLGATSTIDFSGTSLNTGSIGSVGNLTRSIVSVYDGFNLVSNPYPSAINFDNAGVGLTRTNIDNTIWFRKGGNFCTYNWLSAVGVPVTTTQYVPAMQSFWVWVPSGTNGTLQVSNAARTHSTQAFYKTNTDNIFRMDLTSGNLTDQAVVAFFQDAVNNYDAYDSKKMFSPENDYPQIATITPDNSIVVINGQSEIAVNEERVVPVEIKTNVSGSFALNANNISDFNPSVSVYLEDAEMGILQDLRQNPNYTFNSGISDNITRFKLHFGTLTTTSVSNLTANTAITIYEYNNAVYVNTHDAGAGLIEIYDMLGEKIMSQQSVKGLNVLQPKVVNGIYIVKVLTDGKSVTQKVILSK